MTNRTDYVELGLACADVCKALERGMNGRRMDELSQSVFDISKSWKVWYGPTTPGDRQQGDIVNYIDRKSVV